MILSAFGARSDVAASSEVGAFSIIALLKRLLQQAAASFVNIATVSTTTVKTGPGVLQSIVVNTRGTVASTVTVYNNTAASGAKIATIDSLNLSGTFIYGLAFSTGLTIVTTGTVAPDITVVYQ